MDDSVMGPVSYAQCGHHLKTGRTKERSPALQQAGEARWAVCI